MWVYSGVRRELRRRLFILDARYVGRARARSRLRQVSARLLALLLSLVRMNFVLSLDTPIFTVAWPLPPAQRRTRPGIYPL